MKPSKLKVLFSKLGAHITRLVPVSLLLWPLGSEGAEELGEEVSLLTPSKAVEP